MKSIWGKYKELQRQGRLYGLKELPPGSKKAIRDPRHQRRVGAKIKKPVPK